MRTSALHLAFVGLLATACADGAADEEVGAEPFVGHSEASDFVPVSGGGKADALSTKFDASWVMSDAFFRATDAVTAEDVQAFLESSPYESRCWLADEVIGEETAAQAIVRAAKEVGINPIVFLARMQVEKSLISATTRPGKNTRDFGLGCGCPDGRDCYEVYRGLDKQIACAADTLEKLYTGSLDGTGAWRAGKARTSLDGYSITPGNHVTAALYGYTPWVLPNRGGNWLVWNVTRRFANWFETNGRLGASAYGTHPDAALRPFVGSPCASELDCSFVAAGEQGFCHPAGFCVLPCAGSCPDLAGRAYTFCVTDPISSEPVGVCVSQASEQNEQCAALPNSTLSEQTRFVGDSGANAAVRSVCYPTVPAAL